MEMKTTINLRLSSDANVSMTLVRVVDDADLEREAWATGAQMKLVTSAWARGYDGEELEA